MVQGFMIMWYQLSCFLITLDLTYSDDGDMHATAPVLYMYFLMLAPQYSTFT